MRVVVIVQARMGSTRLPGKVLAEVAGRPMIAAVVERCRRIAGIDEVAVAIPDLAEDDPLADAVAALGAPLVRGSATDVLSRYVTAMSAVGAEAIVRVTADCPLLSPAVASRVVDAFTATGADYASNTLERTYPRGLDTEVVRASALAEADARAEDPAEREHVTPYVWRRPDRFRLASVRHETDLHEHRWTVDTPDDLAFVRAVTDALGPDAELDAILELVERRPEIRALNAEVRQKELGG